MRPLILIFLLFYGLSAQNLDSLVSTSARQVQHYKMMPLIPPDQLFARHDTQTVVLRPLPRTLQPSQYTDMDKRIRELEISVTKVTVILDNMQKVNQKHTDRFDSVMRFIEVLITAISGIAIALIGVYFKGRAKN